jgi:hypothetical protein
MIARLGSDGVQRGHEDVYWFRLNVPTSSGELLVLLALGSVVGVTNSRGMSSQVSNESEVGLKCLPLVEERIPLGPQGLGPSGS